MRRGSLLLGVVLGVGTLGVTAGGAAADYSDTCWNGDNPTEIGTAGPVGVGFEAGHSGLFNANYQNICYRVYSPLSGQKITGGVIQTYQYQVTPPNVAGGVQCLPDVSATTQVPYCYVIYGLATSASTGGVAASGWVGENAPTNTVVEITNVSVNNNGTVSPAPGSSTVGVITTTPNTCAVLNGSIGTCTGNIPVGATVTTNDVAPTGPFPVPTGVDPDADPDPLVTVTAGPVNQPIDIPATCIGIC